MGKRDHLITALMMLLVCSNSLNWQGTGNMNNSNMTVIWSYINTNFDPSVPKSVARKFQDTTIALFAQSFSDFLNEQWAPAWNVIVVYLTDSSNSDSVVYGYAFREHWMWYNGYKMNDGYYVSFIIWKDYNCITWRVFNSNMKQAQWSFQTSTLDAIKLALAAAQAKADFNDIWKVAYDFVEGLIAADPSFEGLTMIATVGSNVAYFGKVCAKDFTLPTRGLGYSDGNSWGRYIILQMR